MDKHIQKDNSDEMFRQKFQDWENSPQNDLWDTPGSQVWEKIKKEKDRPPAIPFWKRHRKWYWLAAMLLIFIGVFVFCPFGKKDTFISKEELQHQNIPTFQQQNNTNSQPSSPGSTPGKVENTVSEPENIISSETSSYSPESVPGLKSPQQQQVESNKKTKQYISPKTEISLPIAAVPSLKTTPPANQKIDPLVPGQKKTTSLPELSPLSTSITPLLAQTENEDLPLPLSATIPPEPIDFRQPNSKKFTIGAFISPTMHGRTIKAGIAQQERKKRLNEQESGGYSTNAGLRLQYHLSPKWSLESGLLFSRSTIKNRHMVRLNYTSTEERENENGDFDNIYLVAMATSFGDIEANMNITRPRGLQLTEGAPFGFEIRTRQTLKMVSIPLLLNYHIGKGPIRFHLKGGLVGNFVADHSLEIKRVIHGPQGIRHKKTNIQGRLKNLNNTTLSYLVGAGVGWQIGRNTEISVEPVFSRSITPVYKESKLKTYPMMASVNIGLNYSF